MELGTLLAGRYEVLERLGRGGMGEVWAARDRTLRRQVALKLLPVDEGPSGDLPARFEREAVAAAQINHPNVVALHDRGVHEGMLFLVMELVDGMSLSELIDASGVLAPSRALEIAEQVCAALEATHRAGVVHFDIKPHNVMITPAGTAKVVDFGIAGLVQAQQLSVIHSSRLAPAATLEYAAPEQFTAGRGDARSDLYALGGVLFAMLTGHAPFTGPTAWAVMAAKIGDDAPRLEIARPGLPPSLANLVSHLLDREPALRPQTATEVRERLSRLRADLDDDASPSSETTFEAGRLPQVAAPVAPVTPAAPPTAARPTSPSGPRQLPPDTRLFTGRENELGALFSLVEQARAASEPGTLLVSVIDGMGGVGKTALAVRAAHRLAPHYPDGQLFLDLYGFTEGTSPRDPGDALAALLGGLGVPPQRIPAELDARAAYYRDLLAGTRTLILLDNATDEAQVAPLLPASDTCLVLVTSRKRLKSLDDALPLALDVLSREEAVVLLRKAARLDANAADEPLLEQAVELCGHLPLAVLIAGALLRTGGDAWNLSVLINRLKARRPGRELAAYTDETRSVQAVFDLSYQHLPEELRTLYRRVALLPGPEIDAYAAAALLDSDPETAGRLLQRLSDHSLLTGYSPGRFRPHDLIRAHARTLTESVDPETDRARAVDRLFGYYAHTARTASMPIGRYPRPAIEDPAPAYAPDLADRDAAQSWLRVERSGLDAAFAHAQAHGLDGHTIALAAGTAGILLSDGPWSRALEVHQEAAETAERLGLASAQAAALADLGRARHVTGDYAGSAATQTRALEMYREIGDGLGEATALAHLGMTQHVIEEYAESEASLTRALEIYRALGNQVGEATALNELGISQHLTGDYPGALNSQTRALEIYRTLGNRIGEGNALSDLGTVWYLTGDYPDAEDAFAQALEAYRAMRNRAGESYVLICLGRVQIATGDYPGAVDSQSEAIEILRALGNRIGEGNALANLGRAQQLSGEYPEAEATLTQAIEIYREIGHRGNEAIALNYYAATLAATGRRTRAFELYQRARAMTRELNKPDDEALSLEGIAEHHLAEGDTDRAVSHLREAFEIYERLGMRADLQRVQDRLTELGA